MNTGRLFAAVELPLTGTVLKPKSPMKWVGTFAVKFTVEVTVLPLLATVAVMPESA